MCGIAGIVNLRERPAPAAAELDAMARLLVHRGPDGEGRLLQPEVGLAHRRLSIIDLAGGAQPIANEDASVHVVFNGEIFNYVELRAALLTQGHIFRTSSDTEVLVHLYEEHGLDFVHQLNGQFAIALWDAPRRRLVLARDRLGILPLFFAEHDGRLLFASAIKSVLAVRGRPSGLSAAGLDQVFTLWAPLSPHTLFEGVEEVQPGHMLVVDTARGRVERRRYWDLRFPPRGEHSRAPDAEHIEALRALLIDATRLRLRADVPVGAYLSGGLDSSVLTTIIKHHTDTPLRTFSIGFEDAALDETPAQEVMIRHLGTEHSHVVARKNDIGRHFAEAIWHTECPVLRTAPVPMMLLSRLVREQGYKVVLTGEGSDELLGGYDLYKEAKVRQFWARNPASKVRPRLLERLYPYLPSDVAPARARAFMVAFFRAGIEAPDAPLFSHQPRFATASRCKDIFDDALRGPADATTSALTASLPDELAGWDPFNRGQYLECRTLLPSYLLASQGDRMLMASSIEGRFPFLDHRVAELAATFPPTLLMRGLNEKYVLKRAMGGELPREIVKRKKQPYRAPGVPVFLSGELREETRDLLSSETIRRTGYFSAPRVEKLLEKLEAGMGPAGGSRPIGEKDNMALVGILSAQVLHRMFVDEFGGRIGGDA